MNKIKLNNKIWVLIIPFIVFSWNGCSTSSNISNDKSNQSIEMLAVNDMHGAIDNFPRLAFIVDSLRQIYPNLLLVSAGDNQTGNPINDQYPEKGMPMIELMNELNFNLSAVGNHEFDSKIEGFELINQKAKFDFLCANLSNPANSKFKIKPYKIVTLTNGLKVAFISLLDINSTGIPDSHPDNLKGFKFYDPYTIAPKYFNLKDSCDVFVYINHLGFENDVKLAESSPKGMIDLIIGGHSHTKVDKKQVFNGTMITQAERKLKYTSFIKYKYKNGKFEGELELLNVGNKGSEIPKIREMVDKYNDNQVLRRNIASSEDDFSSYDEIGYLMADALKDGANSEISFVNPGGVRIDFLPKGGISALNVYSMDPFGNEIVLFELDAQEMKEILKNAYKIDESLPFYPSGIKTKYKISEEGIAEDVLLFTSDGKELDLNKKYKVAVNSYIASVYMLENLKGKGKNLFRPTAESMIEYLNKIRNVKSYRNEKRIEIIKE